jgi:putative ABC transport system permease protein
VGAFVYALRIAASSIVAYRLRSILTAVGVAMGVSTVLAIVAIVQGLDGAFESNLSALGTGTIYVSQRPWIILGDWWKYRGRPPLTRRDAEFLEERLTLAESVVPFVFHRVRLELGDVKIEEVRVIGSTDGWPRMSGIEPKEGRFLGRADVDAARPVIALGADVAETLRRKGIGVGDEVEVGGFRMRIVGVMPPRGRVFGRSQDDYIVLPISLFERLYGARRSVTIGVVVPPKLVAAAESEIAGALRVRRGLRPQQDDNFSLNQQEMMVAVYKKLTGSLYATAVGLGIVTLIVAGVGIMNIMLVIGIRKALGARPGVILLQFLVEAMLVSTAGGALGTLLGMGFAKAIAAATPLPAGVPTPAIVGGVAVGVIVGVGFGLVPALRASRLLPVDALAQGG